MPTPDFVLDLRRHIGTAPLSLVGVTAVIVRGDAVLLGRRSDTGALTPITGIVDPGEEPADAARREALEEAGVRIRVDRLAWVHQIPRITYANGDQADYLDLTFRCTWLEGEPYPADGEMTDLAWHPVHDLAAVAERHRRCIELALDDRVEARFEGGA
ncbi:NUDIX domain-containing protein [Agromyces tardus]|jgi:8-oxo-dGTP pyrophosphatase MutT (NUDIX family)|uniref:NUDIX domain-containing protein n=1 Tax=Agromyces tardus TaxID=2583849 RepID=A0A3M8AP28_9MICO|nr:NUDIX domain-containing protein [Agromyces tardus]RNB52265.1 NUDIX domain-containing protein [Agromyces tardus]